MNKYQVLCVDDEPDVLLNYKVILEDCRYEIVTHVSAKAALDYIKENRHSIIYIFSDHNMTEMSGLDLRKCINEITDDIPFTLVTGFYDAEMSKLAMELHISGFIEKPFSDLELKTKLNDLGEKRKNYLIEEHEMVISFIEESYPMLEEIEDLIMSLEIDPSNTNLLNTYFRLLHTIKGTASCVGLKNIPKFTHKYEDLVVKLQNKQIKLSEDVANALLKGLDQLKHMYAEVKNGHFEIDIEDALCIFDLDFTKKSNSIVGDNEESSKVKRHLNENAEKSEDKIGVSINVLDNFMELSGQLTVLRNTLIKSAIILEQRYHGDNDIEIVIDSLDEMHKLSSILQTEISEMRKVGLEVVCKPLRRVVRDSSKTLNKNIDFEVEGETVRVDTSIGKALSNSLVHMIRNSIDHGIELPAARVLAGKNSNGLIRLKSFQDGENIIVELSDDGNGLSLSRIKQKAIEKNLFTTEQLSQMSDQRIFLIIFDSGFSTAQQVSAISGRGVGMDMVKNSIESIGGKISIESSEGNGTKFILTLPIPRSVLIIKSLMIKSKESTFTIPLDEVAEVIRIVDCKESKVLHNIEQNLMLSHHDELLPLVDLNQVLHIKKNHDQFEEMNIVLVRGEGYKYGIIVDEILDIEEIVVKEMSGHFKKANLFMGVTFIGHGSLALILKLATIAEKSQIKYIEDSGNSRFSGHVTQSEVLEFMQFNLKESKNYAFPLHLVNRLEEISTSEMEFSGSIPLVRYRGEVMPLLFIERQLKLCSSDETLAGFYPELLKVIVVNLHNKRFGVVVDEILDIGLTSEQFETRSIDREEFMGTIFIGEKTVTIIDVNFLIDHYISFEKSTEELANNFNDTSFQENGAA